MSEQLTAELLKLNQQLLESIVSADWDTYAKLCDESLTAIEPEGLGHLIEGLEFHQYYFNLPRSKSPRNTTMSSPHVRLMGDVAVITYVRLTQSLSDDGVPRTGAFEETRVWQKKDGRWRHVHFHRSPC